MIKGNNGRDKFTQIPNMVLDMGLSPSAERLYIHIKRVAGEDNFCWKSQDTLARNCRMSAKTVIRAKRELVDTGLIEMAPGKKTRFKSHVIQIVDIWERNDRFYESK